MQHGPASDNQTATEWQSFIAELEAAEVEFARGRPDDFKALWSHASDVTLAGGIGGSIELGWDKVAARIDRASANYADGNRSRHEISGAVSADFAYLVQTEIIDYRIADRNERTRQELRVTMVFRRERDRWRIVHRHADSQVNAQLPG